MRLSATLLCLAGLATTTTTTAQTTTSGYTYTTDANVAALNAIGTKLSQIDAALPNGAPDFVSAKSIFSASGLASVAQTYASSSPERTRFVSYDRTGQIAHNATANANNYANNFALMALDDNFNGVSIVTLPEVASATSTQRGGPLGIANKSRAELIMKGLSLQSMLMGSINHLFKAHAACLANSTSDPAVTYVDRAWALFAAPKGPIALGEKRCPQFATCLATNSGAGVSRVNTKILASFKTTQAAAVSGQCATMLTQIEDIIVPQSFVPIIQGLYREAWEVDDTMSHVHGGADGFVEVVEGWAFASAVLPRISSCNATVGAKVVRNMKMRTSTSDAQMVADGYEAVIASVEQTYTCLKISCGDVNSMLSSFPPNPGPPLWSACQAGNTFPRTTCTIAQTCSNAAGSKTSTAAGTGTAIVTQLWVGAIALIGLALGGF